MEGGNIQPQPQCQHFVARKKRHCRMLVKPGQQFCGEHQPSVPGDEKADGKLRIECPLDRKHTCYAHNLKKHLRICNARPGVDPSYIKKGFNSGKCELSGEDDTQRLLASFTTGDINEVIAKVDKVFNGLDIIEEKFLTHETVEEEMKKPEYGDKTKKHLRQASAILGLMREYELINTKTCYIEFGAGRGLLSYWLSNAVDSTDSSSFLLIERSSPKHKRDNKLDKTGDKVVRIRADIADLVLDELEAITRASMVVGVTKHLCGDATDLALRCLANVSRCKEKVAGCVMTFCCHHRCRWIPYTGKKFFEEVGLSKNDFVIMCGMTSWATCGSGFSRERREDEEADKAIRNVRDEEIGLNREEKKEVGRKCKTIINWGRLRYVKDLGFISNLHYYVPASVSLENVCIVVHNKNVIK